MKNKLKAYRRRMSRLVSLLNFMTRYDVGKLNRGDRVTVGGKHGTVTSPHEPEWIDHKTRAFRKEFQGADIQFDGEPGYSVYIHADSITILEANAIGEASPPEIQ